MKPQYFIFSIIIFLLRGFGIKTVFVLPELFISSNMPLILLPAGAIYKQQSVY